MKVECKFRPSSEVFTFHKRRVDAFFYSHLPAKTKLRVVCIPCWSQCYDLSMKNRVEVTNTSCFVLPAVDLRAPKILCSYSSA